MLNLAILLAYLMKVLHFTLKKQKLPTIIKIINQPIKPEKIHTLTKTIST